MYCSKSIRSGLHPEKKSFKEVDIYTASGMEAVYRKLHQNGLSIEKTKNVKEKLFDMNQNLKFDLKPHITQLSTCIDHCSTCALLD